MRQLLAEPANVFRHIVEEAADFGLIMLDEHGVVSLWNAGAEAIFGYSSDEALGRHFEFIFLPQDRADRLPELELERAAREGRAPDTRWHLAKNGREIFVDGVTAPIRREDRLIGFSKFMRDVTERHQAERRLTAQLAIANLLNEDQPIEAAAREIMRAICENLGWDVGAIWKIEDESLVCIQEWHTPAIEAEAADRLCHGHTLYRGVGLIGEVWDSGRAMWITDFAEATRFPRSGDAARAGLRGAFAFPLVAAGHVTGVMEFFSRAPREPDQALLPIMTLIGAQIGELIDRHHTQEALRASEERFRLMTETAQDAIFTIDERSTITFCNSAVERMFGYAPGELLGRPLDVIMPERLREAHHRGIARFLRTGERHVPWTGIELPVLHRDGHEFPCEISFGNWKADGRVIFTGVARDMTERRRALEQEQQARAEAEAARAQLERKAEEESAFRHLASALTGAVEMIEVLREITNRATHVTRADGVYVERIIQSGTKRMVEVVAAAGKGTPARGLRVEFPGSLTDEIMQNNLPVVLADMTEFGRQMAPYLADTCSGCELLVTPLVADLEPLGALVLLNSSSSGRHFGQGDVVRARTLGDLSSLALRRVRLMEQEREAKEKAEAAVRVRDETLGIVSHDLRSPLTKITLSADLLGEMTSEDDRELVETIRTSARQMERLIQDLLDVARMEAGNLTVAREPIDPEPLVREMCESNGALAQQKQQRIVCAIHGPLPQICGDRDRLVQVFGNLIGNAMKFTPERGIITIEAMPDAGVVKFVVRDTGPGIPEADLRLVFTPYWQAKKTAHLGAGLGLAIVRGIIEAHGGEVRAENAPGGGAMFTFTIPRY